jgi:hypothetical protein
MELDDLIEAASRGVARAMAAEDDVVGFTPTCKPPTGPDVIGIALAPPNILPSLSGEQSDTAVGFQVLG